MDALRLPATALAAAALVLFVWQARTRAGNLAEFIRRLGLGRCRTRPKACLLAALAGALSVFVPAAVALGAGWAELSSPGLDIDPWRVGATLTVKVCLALSEEMIFRAALIALLLRLLSPLPAVFAAALVFALSHGDRSLVDLLVLLVDGVAFGLCYVWTRQIWLPFAWHLAKNVAVWLLGGGTIQWIAGPWALQATRHDLWSGRAGDAGLVDLMLTLVVATAGLAILRRWTTHLHEARR